VPIEIDYLDFAKYTRFVGGLERVNQQHVDQFLMSLETADARQLFSSDRVKSLGQGLFELRIEKKPDLLVRIFFCVESKGSLLVLHAYDKKKNNKINWQRKQIVEARKLMKTLD
jgi:phage-related protein